MAFQRKSDYYLRGHGVQSQARPIGGLRRPLSTPGTAGSGPPMGAAAASTHHVHACNHTSDCSAKRYVSEATMAAALRLESLSKLEVDNCDYAAAAACLCKLLISLNG